MVAVGAVLSSKPKEFVMVAFGRADEVMKESDPRLVSGIGGSLYWYKKTGISFGFSKSSDIDLSCPDVSETDGAYKLSWMYNFWNSSGGFRVGVTTGLYNSSTYRKVIMSKRLSECY